MSSLFDTNVTNKNADTTAPPDTPRVSPQESNMTSPKEGTTTSFNVGVQSEVLSLLSQVRGSALSVEVKNTIRDEVLLYLHDRNEDALNVLNKALAELHVSAVDSELHSTEKKESPAHEMPRDAVAAAHTKEETRSQDDTGQKDHIGTLGQSRPQPQFGTSTPAHDTKSESSPDGSPSQPQSPTPQTQAPQTTNQSKTQSIPQVEKEQSTPGEVAADQSAADTTDVSKESKGAQVASDSASSADKKAVTQKPQDHVGDYLNESKKSTSDVSELTDVKPTKVKKEEQTVSEKEPLPIRTTMPEGTVTDEVPDVDVKSRIREIKRYVNERVGNPVNLIDSHNEIGREYMNTLLAAMKMAEVGTNDEQRKALSALEKSFDAVKAVLKDMPLKSSDGAKPTGVATPSFQQTTEQNGSAPVAAAASGEVSIEEKQSDVPQTVDPVGTKAPVAGSDVPGQDEPRGYKAARQSGVGAAPTSSELAEAREDDAVVDQEMDSDEESVPTKDRPTLRELNSKLKEERKMRGLQTSALIEPTDNETEARAAVPGVPSQVKDEVAPPPQPEPADSGVITPPPPPQQAAGEAPAVDAEQGATDRRLPGSEDSTLIDRGLEQLLSEWSLFKSSGFLGVGPGGKDHKLYKLLANLPMSAVVNGRFDGAKPEILSSIREYMDGWKYEQRIVYNPKETFEEYLKRVIAHILESRKK